MSTKIGSSTSGLNGPPQTQSSEKTSVKKNDRPQTPFLGKNSAKTDVVGQNLFGIQKRNKKRENGITIAKGLYSLMGPGFPNKDLQKLIAQKANVSEKSAETYIKNIKKESPAAILARELIEKMEAGKMTFERAVQVILDNTKITEATARNYLNFYKAPSAGKFEDKEGFSTSAHQKSENTPRVNKGSLKYILN